MLIYNIHAGHCPAGTGAYGAVGILNESTEARKVKNEVIRLLRAKGHTVYDCTIDYSTSQQGCLRDIVSKCNQHSVTLDVSLHLNSGRNDCQGDNNTGGVEVYNYDNRTAAISDRICQNISNILGIKNRGTKYSKNLYVLNNTKNLAILIECCFVDDKDDADRWDVNKCAKAIADGILGTVSGTTAAPSTSNSHEPNAVTKPPTDNHASDEGEIIWQAYASGKWQAYVNQNGAGTEAYAGILGSPLRALRAYVKGEASKVGYLEYRLHRINGIWYNWQRDRQKDKNGENYAGDCQNSFDGLQMRIVDKNGQPIKKVRYRVHLIGYGWLPWITGCGNGDNGYAGLWGKTIDAVQISTIH